MRKLDEGQNAAVDVVNRAINKYTAELEAIVSGSDEQDPIMIVGETMRGYNCQLMVNPQEVARILLGYDFPIYETLGNEAPQGMWDALANHFGLSVVSSFDL